MANEVKLRLAIEGGQAVTAAIDGVTSHLDKLDAGARDAATGTIGLKDALRQVGSTGAGISSTITSVGASLAGLAASFAAFTSIGGKLISVQREFDVLNSSLITVTGSSAKAAQEFAWIKQFAATTPYQLNEVTQGFVKMKALGIDASQAALTSYGNTASAMGKGLNQMIEAVADASTGEFERLKEFGINASKQGDQVALTFQGVTTTIGNSSKEITEYLESIGRVQFAGAMEERAKTLDGALSNLADNWDELFRTINQGGFGSAVTNDVKSLNTALQGLNDTMLNSQKAGEGMVMQMANAAGFAVGTAAVGLLNGSANILNSTVNMLTGGFFELNENVKLLPESLMTNEQRAAALTGKLQDAEANLAKLQQQLSAVPDNIYLKDSTYQAYLLVQQLRAAKEAQDKLSNGAQTSQSESRIKASNAYAEQEQKNQQKINDLMTKSSGISDAYIKRAKEIQEANAGGAMTAGQLATALDGLHGMLKKNTAVNAAAKKEASDYAKELDAQTDTLAKLSGYNKDYEDQARRLVAMREKGTLTEEGYVRAINELVAAQPGMTALTKAQAEASENSAKADIKAFAAMNDLRLASEKQVTQAVTMLGQIEFETTLLAMNTEQRAQATMERELERQGIIKGTTAYDAYIAKLREAMAIKSGTEAGIKATEDLAKASQKAAEASEKYWEDALMRAFEAGKGFFESLWGTIKNTLKTQVLKVLIQGVGLGGASAASAADSGSGLLSMANTISNLPTAINGLTSAASALWAGATATGAGATAGLAAANAASAGLAYSSSVAAGAGSSFLAGSSLSSTLAAIPGWGWAALGVAAVAGLVGSNKFVSAATTGVTSSSYAASGALISKAGEQGTQAQLDAAYKNADALAKSYFETASKLGIKAIESVFNWGSNSGREGANPNTSITVVAGDKTYRSGEVSNADQAAISTMTAQALFTALQASELPVYLSHVFDSMDAATMTSDQISAVLSYAAGLKTVRDALLETREPLQIVKDSASAAFATLATSAATFKTDFVAAIDAGISPDKITQWQALGAALDTLATEDAAAAKKATEAAAQALKNQTEWQQKLDIATGSTTAREIEKAAALAAADDATDLLINQLYALEDAAAAAATLKPIIDKYTAPMTVAQASASLPGGIGNNLMQLDSQSFSATIAKYAADLLKLGAAGAAGAAQLDKFQPALDTMFESIRASEAITKGLSDTTAQLSIELMTAHGNTAGAAAALRNLETQGMNPAQVAAYDYNRTLRDQVTAANSAKSALASLTSTMRSIQDSKDAIAGVNQDPIDRAVIGLTRAVEDFNTAASIVIKEVPLISATATATPFFEAFPDALAALKDVPTDALDAWIAATNPALKGLAFETPEWANAIYDWAKAGREADTTGANQTGANWLDPDALGSVLVAAITNSTIKVQMTDPDYVNKTADQIQALDPATLSSELQTLLAGVFSASSNIATITAAETKKLEAETKTTTDKYSEITKGLEAEGKTLAIALLEAQGNMTGAAAAARALATEGMDALQIAMWDANELVKTQTAILVQHNTLQDELNGLRDTEAQALTRQRNALDESNQALFDQVQGFKTLNSLQEQFAVPQTATQASAAVSAAGYNVTGMDTAGIASYISGILSAPGMLNASGDLTAAGLSTVSTLKGLTGALKILGTEGDKAAEQAKTNATTQASIFDKLATDPQKKARAQTNVDSVFAELGIDVPATAADFLALSEGANTQTLTGQNLVSVLGTVVDDFSLLHSAVKDVTSDYNRALLEAAGNTTGLAAFDKAISDAALIAAGWTQAMIDNVDTTRAATKAAQITKDFNRAMLEAAGNTTGLAEFDKAISDAALITAGWTQAQIAAVDATRANTKAAQITKDFNRALLVASGDDSALAQFDRAISDAALIASGWTAAQVATIHAVEAAAKTLTDIASIKESRTAIASGRQTIVAAQAGFDAPAYWLAQQAMTSAKLSSTNDPALKIKYSSEMQTAIDNGLQAEISALDKARDTRIKALTDEAQLVDDNAAKAKQAAQEMYSALDDIAKYARGLSATDLSPLDPKAKLDAAANEYQRLLALTQGGDASAAAQLTSASGTYLNLAKDYYASTAEYASIFGSVESTLSTIGAQASVYEQIANSTSANYDLDRATAIIDQQYQTDLLALQNLAIGKYDALDLSIGEFQSSLESRAEAQYVEIQTLNVNIENVGNRVTQSGSQVTAAVNQSTNATQTNNALLMQVIALLIQANNTAAVTATATQQTASSSTLATAA